MRTTYVAFVLLAYFGLSADQAYAQSENWKLFQGAPKITDENGNHIKVRGRVLWDLASLEETKGGVTSKIDDNEFRAARLGFEGQYDDVKFKFEVDFAGSSTEYKDVYVTYKGLPVDVTLGQQKTPNSLEEWASSRDTLFMERAAATDAFGLDRRIGVTVHNSTDDYYWSVGVFGNSINAYQDDKSSNTVFAARGTRVFGDAQETPRVHLGASWRHTDNAANGQPKRSSRWGAHLANEKVAPVIGADATFWGAELGITQGPFHAQAEYMTEKGDLGEADGYYVSGAYFLTGDTRAYKNNGGYYARTKPSTKPGSAKGGTSLSAGGIGTWFIAARYDVIDARSALDERNETSSASIAWHPETHLRFTLEVHNAEADTYDAKGINFRTQWDW